MLGIVHAILLRRYDERAHPERRIHHRSTASRAGRRQSSSMAKRAVAINEEER